jgi:hypothetical protein
MAKRFYSPSELKPMNSTLSDYEAQMAKDSGMISGKNGCPKEVIQKAYAPMSLKSLSQPDENQMMDAQMAADKAGIARNMKK